LRALKKILIPTPKSPIDRARQDVLRDQLYRAVASRPYSSDQRARFVRLLEELFSEGARPLSGTIFRVSIQSGIPSVSPVAPAPCQSPAGNHVGVVDLTESEAGFGSEEQGTSRYENKPGSEGAKKPQKGRRAPSDHLPEEGPAPPERAVPAVGQSRR